VRPLRISFSFLLLAVLLYGCRLTYQITREPFYTDDGGLDDYGRFPLIKPYDATNVDVWSIDLHLPPSKKSLHFSSIHDISKIAVGNNVIMAYSPFMAQVDERGLAWFVIVPDRSIETGFSNEADFLKSVHEFGIEKPTWLDPTAVFQVFTKTGCLEWIPDCK
jgi:hypothetical protein